MEKKLITKIRESTSFKLMIIGFIILLLMIPLQMVNSLIYERGNNNSNVASEIFSTWGNRQIIQGPIITIPFKSHYMYALEKKVINGQEVVIKQEARTKIKFAYFLPSKLNIEGEIKPSIRYRSIYEAVIYNSDLNISGTFNKLDMTSWGIAPNDILYNLATISFGVNDLKGVEDRVKLKINDENIYFEPGIRIAQLSTIIPNGMNSVINLNRNRENINFSFNIKLRGSQTISFLPYGKETNVKIKSSWANPSFIGDFLPSKREISSSGFNANWKVIDINRAYPQSFMDEDIKKLKFHTDNITHAHSSFGIDFMLPVDYYQKSERSIKYGILVILLTFLTFFFVEVLLKKSIHPFQYILVGFSLILFFALLVAFSEHIGFGLAYLVSCIATILSIMLYSISVFKNKKATLSLFGIITLFYASIYFLLQLQDYALILGVIMLFVVLSTVMYISRNIDWYNSKTEELVSEEKL